MSGYITPDGATILLNVLTGQPTSWTATRNLYVGLATAIPSTVGVNATLANITEVNTPGYSRVLMPFASASTTDPTTVPVSAQNSSQVDIGPVTQDMALPASYAFLCDTQTGTVISAPTLTAGSAASGGGFGAGTYFWVVTAVNAHGETIASNEITATLTANQQFSMSWGAVTGATSYNVYRGVTTGLENVLVATVTGTSYTDTGSVGNPGSPPAQNLAANGAILYVWNLVQPVQALNGKPIRIPIQGLIIQ